MNSQFLNRFPFLQQIKPFITNPLYIFLFCLLGLVIIFILYSGQPSQRTPSQTITPTVTPEPTPEPNAPYTSNEPLTLKEQQYKQAAPQVFPNRTTKKTGTLVIEAEPQSTRIVLDELTQSETLEYTVPHNNPPFKFLHMPVGKYAVSAVADDYEYTTISFTIEEGRVTRIKLELAPLVTQ